jgi:hypothetical protein
VSSVDDVIGRLLVAIFPLTLFHHLAASICSGYSNCPLDSITMFFRFLVSPFVQQVTITYTYVHGYEEKKKELKWD